jgi:hypothetical protein
LELLEGIREVVRSPILRPAWVLAMGVGLFFAGPYFVVFPLLNREYFGGDVGDLSLLYMTFPAGSILGLILLWRRGQVQRQGRAIALAQAIAALCLLAISVGIPFAATLVAGTIWGVCGAFFISGTRTVFQANASDAHRARVLSVQMLGVMGAGTLGSPLAGFLAAQLGTLGTFAFCGIAMLVFVALVCLFTDIWGAPVLAGNAGRHPEDLCLGSPVLSIPRIEMKLGELHEGEGSSEARVPRVERGAPRQACQALGALGQLPVGRWHLEVGGELLALGRKQMQPVVGKELRQRTAIDDEIPEHREGAERSHLHAFPGPDHARGQRTAVDLYGAEPTALEPASVSEGQRRVGGLPYPLQDAENALAFTDGNIELLPARLGIATGIEAAHSDLQADSPGANSATRLRMIRCTTPRGRPRTASSWSLAGSPSAKPGGRI